MKLHNHKILTQGKIPGHMWDQQFAWVKGYILALEDMLGDVDLMDHDAEKVPYDTSVIRFTLSQVRKRLLSTLTQARATLATLEQMEDEATTSWKQFSGGLEPEDQPTKE